MNYQIKRITESNEDFKQLVKELDKYLAITDQDEHDFYDQFNSIDSLQNMVVAYRGKEAAGCGAFKEFDNASTEIKRMYVVQSERGTGLAKQILSDLEKWSKSIGYQYCILETGKRQVEAVKFYKKAGYDIIPNYDQYIGMENSLCFKKEL
jgi:putative acetyltransferase